MMLFLDTPNTRAVALSPCPSVRAFNTSMTRLNGVLKPAIGAFEGITEIATTTATMMNAASQELFWVV